MHLCNRYQQFPPLWTVSSWRECLHPGIQTLWALLIDLWVDTWQKCSANHCSCMDFHMVTEGRDPLSVCASCMSSGCHLLYHVEEVCSRKGEAAMKDKDKESLGSIELVSGAQLYPSCIFRRFPSILQINSLLPLHMRAFVLCELINLGELNLI